MRNSYSKRCSKFVWSLARRAHDEQDERGILLLTNSLRMVNPLLSPELQNIEREHARALRLVESRPVLMMFGTMIALGIDVLLVAFFIIVVMGFFVSGSFDDVRAAGTLNVNRAYFHAIAKNGIPQQLTIGSAKVVQGTATSYDFFTTVKNENTDWYATFTYTFHSGSLVTRSESGFVMPGSSVLLTSLGFVSSSRPSSSTITVSDLVWHRIDRHDVPDSDSWIAEHGSFRISSPTYSADIGLSTEKVGRTTFTVTNASSYGYWSPQFLVTLERAGAVVGIAKATVSQFASGESREVEVRWYHDVPLTGTVTVTPVINYFDGSSYMSPQGVHGSDIRDMFQK